MPRRTSAPIRRALVKAIRNAGAYGSLNGIFHSFASEETEYPFATYNQVAAPYEDDWTNRMIIAAYDVFVYSRNDVEAHNLDEALASELDGASLDVEDMTTLTCHRVADIPMPPDLDEQGKKVYQTGGSYEIWTDQPL